MPSARFVSSRACRVVSLALIAASASFAVAADEKSEPSSDAIAALRTENEHLRSLIPSQSHAMMDVAYHFTNLWFAGQQRNWPLAQFYFNEARNHIQWAIRLVPVRKTSHGNLKLDEVFSGFDGTLLADLKSKIAAKDADGFAKAYRAALNGCNACHTAAEKPYLHVQVPDAPEVHIIQFAPESSGAR